MIDVYYLSLKQDVPTNSYWDYTLLSDTFRYLNYKTHEVGILPKKDKAIIVLPARHHHDSVEKLNKEIKKISRVVLFLMGDEERLFPTDKIEHDNIEIWIQNPHPDKDDNYNRIGTGYAPHDLSYREFDKDTELFFSGQITHQRRRDLKTYAEKQKKLDWKLNFTIGFTQGLKPEQYFEEMANAMFVPCPSGAVIPDSFRAFEAFQTMSLAILDEVNPSRTITEYWDWLFQEATPTIKIKDWVNLSNYIDDTLPRYNHHLIRQTAWWIKYKRDLALKIKEQIGDTSQEDITAVVCSSPIPSHPDTKIIEETIESIRQHAPNAEIILQIDGIREEQEDKRADYEEYILRILWKCLHQWEKVLPIVFEEHHHQTGMLRETIDLIQSPIILYMEQDTPLVPDYDIPLNKLSEYIKDGTSNLIRFHFESVIPEPHNHLMLGKEKGKELLRTIQWSQRPHIASKAYYERIVNEIFSKESKSFIEDYMHGVVQNSYNKDKMLAWYQHKLHIYFPEGNIKRSYHLDGRAGAEKYDSTQIF